jgi:hypothetical protein
MKKRRIMWAAAALACGLGTTPVARAGDVPMPSFPASQPLVLHKDSSGQWSIKYSSGAAFAEVGKGSGADPAGVSAEFYLRATDGSGPIAVLQMPLGAYDGTSGWTRNDAKRAKYRNRTSPSPTTVTAAEIRAAKSIKLKASHVVGPPWFDTLAGQAVQTAYCVENGGERVCHCSLLDDCELTGGGSTLRCRSGVSDPSCRAATEALPSFSAATTVDIEQCCPESIDDDLQEFISDMTDLGYGVSTGYFEVPTTAGPPPGEELAAVGSLAPSPYGTASHDLLAQFDETQGPAIRLGGQDAVVFNTVITDSSNAIWSYDVSIEGVVVGDPESAPLPRGASIGASGNPATKPLGPGDQGEKTLVIISGDQQTIDDVLSSAALAGLDPGQVARAVVVKIPDVQIPDGSGGTGSAFSLSDLDVPRAVFSVRRRWNLRPGRTGIDRSMTDDSKPFYVFRMNELAPRIPFSTQSTFSPPHANLVHATSRNFDRLVKEVVRHFEAEGDTFVSDQPMLPKNGTESALGVTANIFEGGARCLADGLFCGLDDPLSYYAWTGDSLVLGPNDRYVVVGLNYSRLVGLGGPMAEVSLVGAYHVDHPTDPTHHFTPIAEVGITSDALDADSLMVPVDNILRGRYPKSLRALFPNAFLAQVAGAGTCTGELPVPALCLGAPEVADGEPIVVAGRLQLNPVTGTKPDASEIVPWRLLHFQVTP